MKKRILSFALVLCMVLTLMPMSAFAANIIDSGTCGENLTWTLDSEGTLTVSGTGEMYGYNYNGTPWYSSRYDIKAVDIKSGVTRIGSHAFYDCAALKSITIPDSVTYIGSYAFYGCTSLKSITIPDGVTSIGSDAFYECSNLTSVAIPDSVTTIKDYTFYKCTSLTSVMIGNSVTSIGMDAFAYCSSLMSVTIPDSVSNIESAVFYGCKSLESVVLPHGISDIKVYTFNGCSSLTSITIPDSVTNIGYGAFIGCYDLESITIPDSVRKIEDYAFSNCRKLASVSMGSGVVSIGEYAFYYCASLKNVYYGGSSDGWSEVTIGTNNDYLKNAKTHYNVTDPASHYTAVVTAPTCTEQGYTTYTCTCGYSYVDNYTKALGHDIVHHDGKAATCTESGWEAYDTCARCDYTTYKENPVTGHSYTAKVTAPTCTEQGYTTYICACGDSYVADYTEALGHNYGSAVFTWDGYSCKATFTCARCGDAQTLDCTVTSAVTKAATCTDTGVRTYTASVVFEGKTYTADKAEILEKLPHTAGETIRENEVAPNCTSTGSYDEVIYCTECGEEISRTSKTIAALGHNYGEWTVTTAPTCTSSGSMIRHCSRCEAYEEITIPTLGHEYVHHDAKAPTCTEIGWEAYDTCTRCDYTTYKEIPATGHSYTAKVTEPTCTEQGYTTYTCACGDSYVADYTKALGHNYGSAVFTWDGFSCKATFTCARCGDTQTLDCTVTNVVTKAATCTDTGVRTYTASVVFEGKTYTADKAEILDALGHDYGEWMVTTAPTCTDKGEETHYCSHCDAYETREVAALGHDCVHHDGKAATCTESGWEAYETCTRCSYTTYCEIPATGHSYTYKVTAPTCTDKGYTTYTCACGDSYVADYVDALGHNYVDGKCTRCGAEDPNYKPAVLENPFVDVSESAVYYDAVLWAAENNITAGTDSTHFSPAADCTRGQVVTFLWRAAGCPEPTTDCPFVDVKSSSPYYKAIIWAAEQGITNGVDATHFAPNATVTRAQFVTFLWRYEGQPEAEGTIANFKDASSIATPFKEAVAWAVGEEIAGGYSDGTFRPNATCTRWAVVLFMYRDLA